MTIDVAYSPEHRLIIGRVQGHPRLASFGAIARTAIRFDLLMGDCRIIVDLRRQTGSDLTSSLIHSYVTRFDRALGNRGWKTDFAMFVEPQSFGFGMARIFLAYADSAANIRGQMIESREQLDDWAGVPNVLDVRTEPFRLPGAKGTRAGRPGCQDDWQCRSVIDADCCPARLPEHVPCAKGLMKRLPQSIW